MLPAWLKRSTARAPADPMRYETWRAAALVAVLAWAGVGADSLSSASYGPEEAYKALAGSEPLIVVIAALTALTVTVIAAAYSQLIALFPSGGGGYLAATRLLHPMAGLVSGSALVVDYALTIAISVAAAADALISLAPALAPLKPLLMAGSLALLTFLNLRGVREAVSVLAPIFFAFLLTHGLLIVAGLWLRADRLSLAVADAGVEFDRLSSLGGLALPLGLIAAAYAAGAGTYTGIEALSNNAHVLKPPRARTGAQAMALIAGSLALAAGGIMLLYAIWHPVPEAARTLNAVVFDATLAALAPEWPAFGDAFLGLAMISAALLLLVAANAGFLGGPAVLASMALDDWAPHAFAHLSSRLVAQRGVVVMAAAGGLLLALTGGAVHALVVLYSVNVFLTFSLSLAGLVRHGVLHRGERRGWLPRLMIAGLALAVALVILCVLIFEKFTAGAWIALAVAGALAWVGTRIRRHYAMFDAALDAEFGGLLGCKPRGASPAPRAPTAEGRHVAILVGRHGATALHALLGAVKLLRERPDGVLIVAVGEVDAECYGGPEALRRLKRGVGERCAVIEGWCRSNGLPAKVYAGFGADATRELHALCRRVAAEHPNAVFVAARPVIKPHMFYDAALHGHVATSLQRRLHEDGLPLVILPMIVPLPERAGRRDMDANSRDRDAG